jgi:pimeloyl-ACP methyl ester carboxylesterase
VRRALLLLVPLVAGGHTALARTARAEAPKPDASSWCAPEVETLPGGICHIDGRREGRRTLVIFLHGLIARGTTWQWTQHRAMARNAKNLGFAVIMPTAPPVGPGGSGGYAWPGATPSRESEEALIEPWMAARRLLEARSGTPFDEVFVMGFSSGAYYASSLALRGRLDVGGYALFAGGAALGPPGSDVKRRAPIFVGVCAKNPETAVGARALGSSLAIWNWPSRVDEQPIGHMFGDVHVAHALRYLQSHVPPTKI